MLGQVVYNLLSGVLETAMFRRLEGDLVLANAIVDKMRAPRAESRYDSAVEVKEAFQKAFRSALPPDAEKLTRLQALRDAALAMASVPHITADSPNEALGTLEVLTRQGTKELLEQVDIELKASLSNIHNPDTIKLVIDGVKNTALYKKLLECAKNPVPLKLAEIVLSGNEHAKIFRQVLAELLAQEGTTTPLGALGNLNELMQILRHGYAAAMEAQRNVAEKELEPLQARNEKNRLDVETLQQSISNFLSAFDEGGTVKPLEALKNLLSSVTKTLEILGPNTAQHLPENWNIARHLISDGWYKMHTPSQYEHADPQLNHPLANSHQLLIDLQSELGAAVKKIERSYVGPGLIKWVAGSSSNDNDIIYYMETEKPELMRALPVLNERLLRIQNDWISETARLEDSVRSNPWTLNRPGVLSAWGEAIRSMLPTPEDNTVSQVMAAFERISELDRTAKTLAALKHVPADISKDGLSVKLSLRALEAEERRNESIARLKEEIAAIDLQLAEANDDDENMLELLESKNSKQRALALIVPEKAASSDLPLPLNFCDSFIREVVAKKRHEGRLSYFVSEINGNVVRLYKELTKDIPEDFIDIDKFQRSLMAHCDRIRHTFFSSLRSHKDDELLKSFLERKGKALIVNKRDDQIFWCALPKDFTAAMADRLIPLLEQNSNMFPNVKVRVEGFEVRPEKN